MDELIRINFDSDRPTVSGRDLHVALEVKTAYKDWFPRMCDLYWSSFLVTLCSEIMLYIETPLVSYSYSLNEVSHSCTS